MDIFMVKSELSTGLFSSKWCQMTNIIIVRPASS